MSDKKKAPKKQEPKKEKKSKSTIKSTIDAIKKRKQMLDNI